MTRYGSFFINQDPDEDNPELVSPGWAWLRPTEEGLEIHTFDSGQWTLQAKLSRQGHTHDEIEFIKNNGLTGSQTISGFGTLTFTKGILTGFEPA